jgi:ribosomal protein S12 methylthiotransferase
MKRTRKPLLSVALISLGCAKNLVDSEKMLGALGQDGFIISPDADGADFVVVNTCAFIDVARNESFQAIEEMLRLKKERRAKYVVVTGCMPQRYRGQLLRRYPGIDAVAGIYHQERLPGLFRRVAAKGGKPRTFAATYSPPDSVAPDTARLRLTPLHYAYLRISEGCNNRCSYCTIPDIRGPLRSKPLRTVLEEARELVGDGARELILIGQDTTSYGRDLYGECRLPELVRRVARTGGIRWLRILYTHPAHYTKELMALFDEIPNLCRYIDLPVQHASDRILTAMKRRVTRSKLEDLIGKLRGEVPGAVLRTSVIVGFPGETDADFAELLDFLGHVRFDRLGCFTYSREEGTPAGEMPDQVPEEAKQERLDEVMRLQQEISQAANARFVGRELEMVADGVAEDGRIVARSYREAPDVDGVIIVKDAGVEVGHFFNARITEAGPYDCKAVRHAHRQPSPED